MKFGSLYKYAGDHPILTLLLIWNLGGAIAGTVANKTAEDTP